MSNPHLVGTKAECEQYKATVEKALKLPWRGEHAKDGGRHVAVPTGATGWAQVREHPKTAGLCAVKLLVGAPTKGLSVAEVQQLDDAKAAAVELGEDWKPKEATAEEL